MMLALALAQSAAAPPVADDIVVLARRLQMIEVDMKAPKRGGRLVLERCRITRSSGIAELDAIPCGVAQECVASGVATRKLLATCVETGSEQRVNAVAMARRAAR